jgi:hypothetical protein
MNLIQYGLQRSGTNFIESALQKNYRVKFINDNRDRSSHLQKHCRLYDEKEIIPEPQYANSIYVQTFNEFESLFDSKPQYYIVISKDPYSWLVSYNNWSQKCNWPACNHHYIEEYNLFYKLFINFSAQTNKIIFVRYIDFLQDFNLATIELANKMRLKSKLFSKLKFRNPIKVSDSSKFNETKKKYYLNREYLKEFKYEELIKINELLSKDVASFLGYEIYKPEE